MVRRSKTTLWFFQHRRISQERPESDGCGEGEWRVVKVQKSSLREEFAVDLRRVWNVLRFQYRSNVDPQFSSDRAGCC